MINAVRGVRCRSLAPTALHAPSCRLPRLPLASPRLLQPQQCSAVNYSYTGIAVEIPGCLLVLLQDWSFSRWKSKS